VNNGVLRALISAWRASAVMAERRVAAGRVRTSQERVVEEATARTFREAARDLEKELEADEE